MKKFTSFLRKLEHFSRKVAVWLVHWYQKWISAPGGLLHALGLKQGRSCVFDPTCSEYTVQAIEKYGLFHGIYLGVRRILRCHPWQKNRYDPLR